MPESLLDKYPHLKDLLTGGTKKTKPASDDKDKNPAPLSERPENEASSSSAGELPRKSILGPGVGVRPSQLTNSIKPVNKSVRKVKAKAEDLYTASLAADNDQWLSFQIDAVPATKQIEQLKMWLATNKPSQIPRSSGVGWIAIKMKDRPSKNLEAKQDWDSEQGEKTMDMINTIAAKHGVTGGKWMCHVPRHAVDKFFSQLSLAMFSGGLGPTVYMIKVSPVCDDGGRGEHVMMVYNPDYQDITQVMRVENLIRSAGVVSDLLYKPDIFSALGIYRNNKWGFRASIFSSRVMVMEGRSRITIAGSEVSYYNSNKGFEYPDNLDISEVIIVIDFFSTILIKLFC